MTKELTISDVQKRVDVMPAAMNAKGLREPKANISLKGNESPIGYMAWKDVSKVYGEKYEVFRGETATEVLSKMDTYIANLPNPEETRMKEFMTALSDVIELGRQNGVDVDFVNPLVDTMRRLSENIITDQRPVELRVAA